VAVAVDQQLRNVGDRVTRCATRGVVDNVNVLFDIWTRSRRPNSSS